MAYLDQAVQTKPEDGQVAPPQAIILSRCLYSRRRSEELTLPGQDSCELLGRFCTSHQPIQDMARPITLGRIVEMKIMSLKAFAKDVTIRLWFLQAYLIELQLGIDGEGFSDRHPREPLSLLAFIRGEHVVVDLPRPS